MAEIRIIKCGLCGKEYETKDKRSKYCSEPCRKEGKKLYVAELSRKRKEETKERIGIRICPICGKDFEPPHYNNKTCGPECAKERHRLLKNEAIRAMKQEKAKKKKIEPAWKVNEKARKLGMSYGKYELMKQLEAQRKERKNGH